MRMRGLLRKEFLQIVRDPSSLAIAFLLPVVLLVLFGYGVSLDVQEVPVAVVIEQPGRDAASFASAFRGSRYFRPVEMRTLRQAERALREGAVDGIVHLRSDFARQAALPAGAPVQVIVNGVDANKARLVLGYVEGTWSGWLRQWAAARGQPLPAPVALEQRVWFNADVRSRNFLVPGLIAVIMTLTGAMLTAMVMAREWERGTMEALLVTPVRVRELLAGKIVAYFTLGMGGMALSVAMAVWLFEVPLRGSLWLVAVAGSLFMLTALGMGLLISAVARNQFLAGQIAVVTTFLPAFLLSGFVFDVASMPAAVRVLTRVLPARYFVAILQTEFLAGDVWAVTSPSAAVLALMAAALLALTRRKTRKSLE